jgi:hypothetical protein
MPFYSEPVPSMGLLLNFAAAVCIYYRSAMRRPTLLFSQSAQIPSP